MAKSELLRHIKDREIKRVARWRPVSVLELNAPAENISANYGTRHRLSLSSHVEYDIFDPYTGSMHPAHDHARARLIHHIYGEQERIAHDMLSALYGSASTEEMIDLVNDLLRSMREHD